MNKNNVVQKKVNNNFAVQDTYGGGAQVELNPNKLKEANAIFSQQNLDLQTLSKSKFNKNNFFSENKNLTKDNLEENKETQNFTLRKSEFDNIDIDKGDKKVFGGRWLGKKENSNFSADFLFNKQNESNLNSSNRQIESNNTIKINKLIEKENFIKQSSDLSEEQNRESISGDQVSYDNSSVLVSNNNDIKSSDVGQIAFNEQTTSNGVAPVNKKPNFLFLILFFVLLITTGSFVYFKFFHKTIENTLLSTPIANVPEKQSIILNYWGLWESQEMMAPFLRMFEEQNPNISVLYNYKDHKTYLSELKEAFNSNLGPDIFRFHNSWTTMLNENLDPMPSYVMSEAEFQKTFFPVNFDQLKIKNDIYGMPLSYEGLALLYNKSMFQNADEYPSVGITWQDLKRLATKLTKKSNGKIVQAGIALGLSSNVDNFSDILGMLLFQVGADFKIVDDFFKEAMEFYLSFYSDKIWSAEFEDSVKSFSEGKVAMIIIPSWRIHEIEYLNSSLVYGIVPTPIYAKNQQNIRSEANSSAVWASVWSDGVNVNAKPETKEAAWKLLRYLASKEVQLEMSDYVKEGNFRSFGSIFSRQDLAIESAANDGTIASEINFSYLANAMNAKSWYLNSRTHDGAINDQMIGYFASAIDSLSKSSDINKKNEVYGSLQNGINAVLNEYGL